MFVVYVLETKLVDNERETTYEKVYHEKFSTFTEAEELALRLLRDSRKIDGYSTTVCIEELKTVQVYSTVTLS